MSQTSYSKLSQRDIDRAETDLLINLSALTQRGLAKMIGCHESKVSRTDWRYIAAILCAFQMASDISPISRAFQHAINVHAISDIQAGHGAIHGNNSATSGRISPATTPTAAA